MRQEYSGPLRDEPLVIEFHNTLYMMRGKLTDGLLDGKALAAWLDGLGDRMPPEARRADPGRLPDFLALREAIREALHAAVEDRPIPMDALRAINDRSRRSPHSAQLHQEPTARPHAAVIYHADHPADIALGAIATSAIALLAGPERSTLRACSAPACVLIFAKDHARRAWCSPGCGNRARQARHYRRTHHMSHKTV